jgi:tripartite-type tricarboxylate transporter receptor subunit TctC
MRHLRFIAIAILGSCWALAASAQDFPSRPIKLIVSIAAGSVTDVIMRAAAQELQSRLGQPLVIENQGGGSGILAGQSCAKAEPDGHTLCVVYHSTLSFNPLLFDKLPYDADSDFVPISRLFFLIEGLIVSSSLNVNSIAELKSAVQAKPGALNFGTLGRDSFPDLFLKWLNQQWNSQIVGVPYRGGGPIVAAVLANEVQIANIGVGNFLGQLDSGRVKALGILASERSPLLPNVPTFEEAGLGGYPSRGWWGLVAPKGTSRAVVDKVNAEFVKLFKEPKFVEFLNKQAVVAAPTSPEEFGAFLKEDRKAAQMLIQIANAKRQEYKPEGQ